MRVEKVKVREIAKVDEALLGEIVQRILEVVRP